MKAAAVWIENNNKGPGPVYSHLAPCQAAGYQTPRGSRRYHCHLRKALQLMQPRPHSVISRRRPESPGKRVTGSKGGHRCPTQTGNTTEQMPPPAQGWAVKTRLQKEGRALLWWQNAQGEHMAGERHGMRGASCGLREPRFYLGFAQFKLCHFIHVPMSPLGSRWLPTAFTVKADIFIKVHRPLHVPPSATPANSILLSLSPLLPHQPCCLCTVSNSLIRLYPRTFALTVSSSWNTFPLDMCIAPLLHSGLPGNVTLSHRPYLRAAHLNSAPLPILCASLSQMLLILLLTSVFPS